MLRFTAFACLFVLAIAAPFDMALDDDWEMYKRVHDKAYDSAGEETYRRGVWEKNLDIIKRHNLEESLGVHTYTLGMNKYGDLTTDEFVSTMNGYRAEWGTSKKNVVYTNVNVKDLPDTVDWRPKGYVTGVKDQKQCGSCWAFSTTGSLEGQMFNKTGMLVSLSEQNLVDCSRKEGNMGCQGGLMDDAFQYVIDNGGLDTEDCYPYKAVQGTCMYKSSCNSADVVKFNDIPTGNEMALQQAVATVGPVSVAIDAALSSFHMYHSGIYDDSMCRSDRQHLDHGVLAVGYGTMDGKDYWLVKNSWGMSWGDQGYIMMSRNKNNQCGIATAASYPTV
ncbi:cathepsin L2 cysteine protease [Apostichopus japonicus]|uniref:Cathepsin L2 cysteine protease n=1 Tax=Stichopus japonicus TaxID=307972 RepID=A0A2G8KEP3_STIJA|nr:cathepsin L2 cysteine protease [Apostichopus japonicus]